MAMSLDLTPAHTVLLAVHYATNADIASLTTLAARHGAVLRKDLLLRILLGYLPEAVPSSEYVELIQAIEAGAIPELAPDPLDTSPVAALSRDAAVKKVRKLHLPPLHRDGGAGPEADGDDANPTVLFLLRRARRVDDEAGLLDELPALLAPFVGLAPCVRTLLVSAVLPLLRRNYEYHADEPIDYTLRAFEDLPDRVAAEELLSRTGAQAEDLEFVGRDLRGLVGPWLYDERRWTRRKAREGASGENAAEMDDAEASICPGWEQVLEWLMAQASRSWRVAVSAVDQWDGPSEADLGGYGAMWLSDDEQGHLEQTYARAALACAYLIPEPSVEALEGAFSIATKLSSLLDLDPGASLHAAAAVLAPVTAPNLGALIAPRHKRHLRNELLQNSNRLTATTPAAIKLLQALILSAFILTIAGSPTTVRKAAELALLQDERDQKAEAVKLIHTLSNNGPNNNDKYWIKARNEILWLRDWGSEEDGLSAAQAVKGVFGELTRECIEVEVLKALLANNRFTLARSLYEDSSDKPISRKLLQDTIFAAAMSAYDNASNPNRTRGGVKKCEDIIHAFPRTAEKSLAATQRIEALIKATHALSEFRLVLKQGEPFTPVVLRVHADPISIVDKILEQNPKSYTRLHDLVDIGANMVEAGLTAARRDKADPHLQEMPTQRLLAERRITAMCIDAALAEDDFETAFSYVTTRLSAIGAPPPPPAPAAPTSKASSPAKTTAPAPIPDDYSWKAALQAGKYRLTPRTVRPTHLGLAGAASPALRHLEQRLACLATALRIAPAPTLAEILAAYRRAEEELEVAVRVEAEAEDAWERAADEGVGLGGIPGGFDVGDMGGPKKAPRGKTPGVVGVGEVGGGRAMETGMRRGGGGEEAPMSLFDLSRASVLSAQRNLTALSSLQRSALGKLGGGGAGPAEAQPAAARALPSSGGGATDEGDGSGGEAKRVRKRDQLKEAAMGTLVSGVGWLINAPAQEREREGG